MNKKTPTLLLVLKKKGQLFYIIVTALSSAAVGLHGRGLYKKESIASAVRRGGKKGQLTRPDCNSSGSSHGAHLTTAQPCKLLNNKSQPSEQSWVDRMRLTVKQTEAYELFTSQAKIKQAEKK